jgi:enamine deaminase RidA (YjgF/YER057c/UK114 family)
MTSILTRLGELGLELPEAPKPVASYVPAVMSGNLIFVAGQVPFAEGKLIATGSVPSTVSIEQAQACARQCVLNGLAVVADALDGDLERLRRIVRIGVFVASEPGFHDQPLVANGASDMLLELLGDAGRHARAAVGSVALPLGAPVEVEMTVEAQS